MTADYAITEMSADSNFCPQFLRCHFLSAAIIHVVSIKLAQLQTRISELEQVADEIQVLAGRLSQLQSVQPELQIKAQQWYRGTRKLLEVNAFSGLREFDACYEEYGEFGGKKTRVVCDIERYISRGVTPDTNFSSVSQGVDNYQRFLQRFRKARSLALACAEEVKSREIPVRAQLSFEVADDEFQTSLEMLNSALDETLIRAAGVIARVALERHLFTVSDVRGITPQKNPPIKKKADTQDVMATLVKANIITAIQKSELDGLFTIGNNCAHPKETVNKGDVGRLIARGRELAAVIL